MTYETLETELNAIIAETKAEFEAEEKGTKTANYLLLKDWLVKAEKLKAEISEGKQYGMKPDLYKYDLMQIKDPIY